MAKEELDTRTRAHVAKVVAAVIVLGIIAFVCTVLFRALNGYVGGH